MIRLCCVVLPASLRLAMLQQSQVFSFACSHATMWATALIWSVWQVFTLMSIHVELGTQVQLAGTALQGVHACPSMRVESALDG
jgi:hypothetical protein